jgi:methionine-rich copper-binding protein CopC
MTNTRGARRPHTPRSVRRWFGFGAALCASLGASALLALGAAAPASAHDALESATPAADSTVTDTLSSVALTFSEDLLALGDDTNGFAIQVLDGDDRHYESGCVAVKGPTATTEVATGPAGTYEVVWQVVSSDGHPTSGSYTFEYSPSEPGKQSNHTIAPLCGDAWAGTPTDDSAPLPTLTPDPNAAATRTPAPDVPLETPAGSALPSAGETPSATDTAAADGSDTDAASSAVPLWAIALGGIVALGLIGAVIALTLRRSRRLPGESEPGPDGGDRTP